MQNRDAQRRFRERKERHKTLHQRAIELEAKCQELSEGFHQKPEEVSRIIKEKEALTGEIQDLRKRWRLMLMLLRLPTRLQLLSTLLGSDLSSTSDSFVSSSPSSYTMKAEPLDVPLEDLLGCLQELLLPNDDMPHAQHKLGMANHKIDSERISTLPTPALCVNSIPNAVCLCLVTKHQDGINSRLSKA
jgi:hypothetical protein